MVASPNHPIIIVCVLKPTHSLEDPPFWEIPWNIQSWWLKPNRCRKVDWQLWFASSDAPKHFLILFKSLGTAPVASLSFLSPTVIGCFARLNSDLGWWNQHQPSAVSDPSFNLVARDCPNQRHRCFSQPLFLVDTFPSSSSPSRGWRVPKISAHRIRSQYLVRKSTMNVLGGGFKMGHLNKAIAVDE